VPFTSAKPFCPSSAIALLLHLFSVSFIGST
jgi:hypothetical protein